MKTESLLGVGYAVRDIIGDELRHGGAAAGVTINGSKLGLQTGLCAVFGTDQKSSEYWEYLAQKGVDLALSVRYPGISIPENIISHADRTKGWNDNGISSVVGSVTVDQSLLQQYGILHLGSAHYQLVEKVIEKHNPNQLVSFSPGPKTVLDPEHYLSPFALQASDILFLNEEECLATVQHFGTHTASDILNLGPRILVVTQGGKGSTVTYREGDSIQEVSIPVQNSPSTKESTGAGDAYALGFLCGVSQGFTPEVSGRLGTALAHAALQRTGVEIESEYLTTFTNYINSV